MTMPRPPVKPIKVPKPPEYLPPTTDIPPELLNLMGESPANSIPNLAWFLSYWQKTNPQGLYQMKLTDYLVRLYQEKMQKVEADYQSALATVGPEGTVNDKGQTATEKYLNDEAKVRTFIEGVETQAKFKREMNFPIEDMPYYEEVSKISITPSVQKGYNEFINQSRVQQMADQQQQSEYSREYQEYVTKVGQQAVLPGQKERLAQYEQGQEALGSPESIQARREIVAAVARGEISPEEAFGPNSAWSRWQNEQATANSRQLNPKSKATLNPGQLYEQQPFIGAWTPEEREAERLRLVAQGQGVLDEQQRQMQNQSRILASQYPDAFKQWQTDQWKYSNRPNDPFGFARWATAKGDAENPLTPEQTAFQQRMKDTELTNWKTYGDIYGEYTDYLNRPETTDIQPINKWIETNPLMKLAYEQRLSRQRVSKAPYGVWR